MSGMSFSSLVEHALAQGRAEVLTKLAQTEGGATSGSCEKCGNPTAENAALCAECADKANQTEQAASGEETDQAEKTSSAYVLKLAAAVEFINQQLPHGIEFPRIRIKQAQDPVQVEAVGVGPGEGPNTLPVTEASDQGQISPDSGEATTENQVPVNPPLESGAYPTAAPTAVATDASEPELPPYPPEGILVTAGLSSSKVAHLKKVVGRILQKRAEESSGATIAAPTTNVLPEDQPSPMEIPAEAQSQANMVASNEAAIDYTKAEAKEEPKTQMGQVLDEPAQTPTTDKVLDNALGTQVVDEAGAKVARARLDLQKLAARGCTCGHKNECGHCKIASAIKERRQGDAAGIIARAFQNQSSRPARSVRG